ncbi:MAG: DUF4190 domain-containing protein [Terriglobales bacterium]
MSDSEAVPGTSYLQHKFCATCGQEMENGAAVCPRCGRSQLEPSPPPPAFAPAPPAPASAAPTRVESNGLAIASLVLGILWFYWLGSILAVVFGHVALAQIRRSGGSSTGRGMAIAGLVLGYVGIAFLILIIVFAVSMPLLFHGHHLVRGAVV